MPFDWMNTQRPAVPAGRFRDQHVRAIRERARLLFNLGFSEAEACRRIEAALAWEFDADVASTPRPDFYAEIPALVAAVYAHALRGRPEEGTGRR